MRGAAWAAGKRKLFVSTAEASESGVIREGCSGEKKTSSDEREEQEKYETFAGITMNIMVKKNTDAASPTGTSE